MNRDQARQLVNDTFTQSFHKDKYRRFIRELLNQYDESKASNWNKQFIPDAFKEHIDRYERVGTYTAPGGEKVDILIVHLTRDSKLERARTALRNFVAHHLKIRDEKDSGLVAFVSPTEETWRFSFVKMEYETAIGESGRVSVSTNLTPARRFSYLVGEGESCHTAQSRFLQLLQVTSSNPTLDQIAECFSVETVTKEFFTRYYGLFQSLKNAMENILAKDKAVCEEFRVKRISTDDFAKKLLGQIVFLYFIQKKGWLGVQHAQEWGSGPRNFLRRLARGEYGKFRNFFNEVLERVFYDTLATDRGPEAWCETLKTRIPFLNGGLFEPLGDYDWKTTDLILPNDLFFNTDVSSEGDSGTGILDVFDRYNFTVNEAEPLEQEVAIDPEMLGKVFENLIEENLRKGTGAYYTPREIVHHMCQESLVGYLYGAVNAQLSPAVHEKAIQGGQFNHTKTEQPVLTTEAFVENVPREDLSALVHLGDQAAHYEAAFKAGTTSYERKERPRLPKSIEMHANKIDRALRDITVCDPAIGSGAFPVGMMTEIVRARLALNPYFDNQAEDRNAYHFKRHAIHSCLYGVDIDRGAVEIAKLRLWLSLVVDEEDVKVIKPLPNLDFKIVAGNSLLGFPFQTQGLAEIEKLKLQYFDEAEHGRKAGLKRQIEKQITAALAASEKSLGYRVDFDFKLFFSEVFREHAGFDLVIANPPYISHDKIEHKAQLKARYSSYEPFADIYCYFIEKAVDVLRPGGHVTFITSNSYIKADYGKPLRLLLSRTTCIEQLLNIEESQMFESAIVNVAILVAAKGTVRHADFIWSTNTPHTSGSFQQYVINQGFAVPRAAVEGNRWALVKAEVLALRDKIERSGKTLEALGTKIRLGIATGANDAFLIDEEQKRHLQKLHKKNLDIIKPVLRGRDILRFSHGTPDQYILLTKNGINVPGDYPDIRDHLEAFGPKFKSRGAKGQHWYNLRACAFFDDFEREKIVWIELTDKGRFSLCESGIYLLNSAYFLLPPDGLEIRYLLGVLNSTLISFYCDLIAQTSGMGTNRWFKEYVQEFPIVIAALDKQRAVAKLVDKIIREPIDDGCRETQLNEMVYGLYGITEEEIRLIEGRSAPA